MLKGPVKAPLPWDILVFVTITTVGFGFSVHQLMGGNPAKLSRLKSASASTHAQRGRDPEVLSSSSALDLGCIERQLRKQRVQAEDTVIRVKGKFCSLTRNAMKDFKGVSVRNVTTGYDATIFFQGADGAFMTDYLVIQNGTNLIRVEWRLSDKDSPEALLAEVYYQ